VRLHESPELLSAFIRHARVPIRLVRLLPLFRVPTR
jgi:hypothetical protein